MATNGSAVDGMVRHALACHRAAIGEANALIDTMLDGPQDADGFSMIIDALECFIEQRESDVRVLQGEPCNCRCCGMHGRVEQPYVPDFDAP